MQRGHAGFVCLNPKCRSKNLRPVEQRQRKGSRRGNQQLVYECEDCGWKVGELALERARVRRELGD
jgi:hypothetical protein